MKFKRRTLDQIADMVCGNYGEDEAVFPYRSSSYITQFFQDADTDYAHDGSTRKWWVAGTLETILCEPQSDPQTPPDSFQRVVSTLMDQGDAVNEDANRPKALEMLNAALAREGYEAFYADDRICYLRHTATNQVVSQQANPVLRANLCSMYLELSRISNGD